MSMPRVGVGLPIVGPHASPDAIMTVAMAADENRMPCADPDEAARILAFLARLAAHDAALPPSPPLPDGAGTGPEGPREGTGTENGAPDPR